MNQSFAKALLVSSLIFAVGFFHVAGRVTVIQRGYALSDAARENRELVREQERLRMQVASLRVPSRIEAYARQRLGMAPPAADRIVVVSGAQSPTKGALARAGDP